MAAMAVGERSEPTTVRRARARRAPAARVDRAHGAKVDLGCLPRLLGYTLRRAHLSSWRQYVAVIGEQKLRPGLFSLLVLVGSNPGIAQIELGTHLGIDKASIVALLDRLERPASRTLPLGARPAPPGHLPDAQGTAELETLIVQVRALEKQMSSRFTRAELDQLLGPAAAAVRLTGGLRARPRRLPPGAATQATATATAIMAIAHEFMPARCR